VIVNTLSILWNDMARRATPGSTLTPSLQSGHCVDYSQL
jgi:hypothetical protein